MKNIKKKYNRPEIELIKLDNEISLQLVSQSLTSPDDPFATSAKGTPAGRVNQIDEDPYQYETW